jgi:hypothetical protein
MIIVAVSQLPDQPGAMDMGSPAQTSRSGEAQRRLVHIEQRFGFVAVILVHFAQADDLTHDFGIITDCFGLAIDILDVVADALFLFLEPLDPFDEKAQLVGLNDVAHDDSRIILDPLALSLSKGCPCLSQRR